jgi:hypothetical protein
MRKKTHNRNVCLRHTLATLAYRASKTIRDAPDDFAVFRPAKGSRSAGEILAHMCDLMDWVLTQARGKERWRTSKPREWQQDADRFFRALTTFDEYLASDAVMRITAERAFQGAVADALTHTGQIAMLRRMAGARVRAENYSRATIVIGTTSQSQAQPVSEYGR